MWPDRVSNPGPLALESDALPIALCGPALNIETEKSGRTLFAQTFLSQHKHSFTVCSVILIF